MDSAQQFCMVRHVTPYTRRRPRLSEYTKALTAIAEMAGVDMRSWRRRSMREKVFSILKRIRDLRKIADAVQASR